MIQAIEALMTLASIIGAVNLVICGAALFVLMLVEDTNNRPLTRGLAGSTAALATCCTAAVLLLALAKYAIA